MHEGLLWYDTDAKRSTRQKIDDAARRFQERFGRPPNCCHVHPSVTVTHDALHIVPDPYVRPHHYWIGVDPSLPKRPGGRAPSAERPARSRRGAA